MPPSQIGGDHPTGNIAPVHHGIECDGCKTRDIRGPRYSSVSRQGYDLCHSCFAQPWVTASDFVTITDVRIVTQHQHTIHHGVTCDGCQMQNITGPRYKSVSVANFDLCHGCFAQSWVNVNQYMLLLTAATHCQQEQVIHYGVSCNSCQMQDIRGPRYRSRVMAGYDLCHGCYGQAWVNRCDYVTMQYCG